MELEGYINQDDNQLPAYREFPCVFKATVKDRFGNIAALPVKRNEENEPEAVTFLSRCHIFESISSIEDNLKSLEGTLTTIQLPEKMTVLFRTSFRAQNPQLNLISTSQEFPKSSLQNVVAMTRQKLLDTLLELDKEFPNLENEFKMNDKQTDKVQNIVNTTIYGNNNPLNIAAGEKIMQKDFQFNTPSYAELQGYGVEESQIEELKTIVNVNQHDKPTLMSKGMKWLGTVASSIAAKGLSEHIPAITEFVHKMIS
jgi:AbiTii